MCVCVCVRNAWVRTRSVWQVATVMNMVVDNCVRANMCGGCVVRSGWVCGWVGEECVGVGEKCVAGGGCKSKKRGC